MYIKTEVFFLSYPGVRSGGIGSGLSNPSLPTNQNVSSTPLPCKRTTGAHMTGFKTFMRHLVQYCIIKCVPLVIECVSWELLKNKLSWNTLTLVSWICLLIMSNGGHTCNSEELCYFCHFFLKVMNLYSFFSITFQMMCSV